MVHVKICPLRAKDKLHSKGKPTTEFHIDGKPQIYCYGFYDCYNYEPLEECKRCADWVYGEQCEKDYEEYLNSKKKSEVE